MSSVLRLLARCAVSGVAAALLVGVGPGATVRGQEYPRQLAPAIIPGQPYLAYIATDSLTRTIQYYMSEPHAERRLPLVLFVQGSGASSLFGARPDGRVAGAMGHSTVRDVFHRTARVLIVEKPGVSYLDSPRTVEEASPAFHREHTLERWAAALRTALRAACADAETDCSAGVLVIGHSEGGVAAARVAATDPVVTHVALLAGEGPSQLFSLLLLARDGEFFTRRGETAAARESYLLEEWRRIRAQPDAADRFFFGHPYRRWSSFLSTSPAAELANTRARVFIAQGTADRAVVPASADALFAELAARDRDVCYSRVDGADHSFALASSSGWQAVLEQVREWFTGSDTSTSYRLCSPSNTNVIPAQGRPPISGGRAGSFCSQRDVRVDSSGASCR